MGDEDKFTKVELIRLEETNGGIIGALRIAGEAFCVTLEPPFLDNKNQVSAIPTRFYVCKRTKSKKFGETFEVTGVPERSRILFHAGNTVEDTKGCILLGQYFGKLKGDRAVLNSGNTFKKFMARMGHLDMFILCVTVV